MPDETGSTAENPQAPDAEPGPAARDASAARFARALLALTGAATLAVAPFAAPALAPADAGHSAHAIPAYLISRLSHDVGHNDWAFQGDDTDRIEWVAAFLAIGLFWLVVVLWMRSRPAPRRLWLRVLLVAWAVEGVAGCAALGLGLLASWTEIPLDTLPLKLADLCSPWWACVAAVLVVARAERDSWSTRAALHYGGLLALVLLAPLPGPDALKAIILAASAAVPAVMTPRVPASLAPPAAAVGNSPQPATPPAAASG